VRGRAEALLAGGDAIWPGADPEYVRVTPTYIASWGIDGDPYRPAGRAARPVSPATTQPEEGAS
jgi:hypothetical protein